jgi:TolA-binding protein
MDAVTYPQEKVALFINDQERYRDIGYLPPDDLLAHMNLALGRAAFEKKDFSAAAGYFQTILDQYGASEMVPEALYFMGVAKNRSKGGTSNDRRAVWKRLMDDHPKSDWAKKASFVFE